MPDTNRVSATMSAEDIAEIKTHIAAIRAKLPFLINLSDEERQQLPKMGDRSEAFHNKVQGYMQSDAQFTPSYVDPTEVANDQELRTSMKEFAPEFFTLARALGDTVMKVDSELWLVDLAYYNNVRHGTKMGVTNAQAIYNDLKTRFPGRSGGSGGTTPPGSAKG